MHKAKSNGNGAGRTAAAGASSSTSARSARPSASPPAPGAITDLADGCVRHVERLLGVKLDYEPETLPVLDHYIALARAEARLKPEVLSVLAQTAGAYLGEVVRRRYASWWRMDSSEPTEWQVEFESVYLAFNPMRLILEAVLRVGVGVGEQSPAERLVAEGGPADHEDDEDEDDDDGEDGDRIAKEEDDDTARAVDGGGVGGGDEVAQLELEEEDHAAVALRLAELPPVSEEEFYAPSTRVEVIDIAVEAIRARRLAAGDDTDTKFSPIDYRSEE